MDNELVQKAIQQVEYYFGDENLSCDAFLNEEMRRNDGWIPLATIIRFARIKQMNIDIDFLFAALQKSEQLRVKDSPMSVQRKNPYTGSILKALQKFKNIPYESLIDENGTQEDQRTLQFEQEFTKEKEKESLTKEENPLPLQYQFLLKSRLNIPHGYKIMEQNGSILKRVLRKGENPALPPESGQIQTSKLFTEASFYCPYNDPRMPTPYSEVFLRTIVYFTSSREIILKGPQGISSFADAKNFIPYDYSITDLHQFQMNATSWKKQPQMQLLESLVKYMSRGEVSVFICSPQLASEVINPTAKEQSQERWISFRVELLHWIPHACPELKSQVGDGIENEQEDGLHQLRSALLLARVEKDSGNSILQHRPRKALRSYHRSLKYFNDWKLWCGEEWREYVLSMRQYNKETRKAESERDQLLNEEEIRQKRQRERLDQEIDRKLERNEERKWEDLTKDDQMHEDDNNEPDTGLFINDKDNKHKNQTNSEIDKNEEELNELSELHEPQKSEIFLGVESLISEAQMIVYMNSAVALYKIIEKNLGSIKIREEKEMERLIEEEEITKKQSGKKHRKKSEKKETKKETKVETKKEEEIDQDQDMDWGDVNEGSKIIIKENIEKDAEEGIDVCTRTLHLSGVRQTYIACLRNTRNDIEGDKNIKFVVKALYYRHLFLQIRKGISEVDQNADQEVIEQLLEDYEDAERDLERLFKVDPSKLSTDIYTKYYQPLKTKIKNIHSLLKHKSIN